jgi:hypothetical protein
VLQASLVVEALARSPSFVPYVGCGILSPSLLSAAAGTDDVISEIVAGRRRIAIGLRPDLNGLATIGVDPHAVGYDAAGADALLVLSSGPGRQLALAGPTFASRSIDLTTDFARVELGSAHVELVGENVPTAAFTWWEATALTMIAADLVGAMRGALSRGVDHAMERHQFGVPIGSFQALQHLLADQLVSCEGAEWSVRYAAWAAGELSAEAALMAARTAKAYSSSVARTVVEAALQVFGGIGFTWESWIHVYLRRVIVASNVLGRSAYHYPIIARAASKDPLS